jgi:Fe-S cluster assembly protein SufD
LKIAGRSLSWEVPARSSGQSGVIAELAMPLESLEAWRYSPIESVMLEEFDGTPQPLTDATLAAARRELARYGHFEQVVLVDAGRVRSEGAIEGVSVREVEAPGEWLEEPEESLLALSTLLAPARVEIEIAQGTERLAIVTGCAGEGVAGCSWLRVRVAGGADVEIVHLSTLVGRSLVLPTFELEIGERAHAVFRQVLQHDQRAVSLGYLRFEVGEDASLDLVGAAPDMGYSRVRTDGRLAGARAAALVRSGCVVGANELMEYRTFLVHDAPHTRSDLLYKGVIAANGASIYTGLITITPNGGGSDAFQTNRNVLLSPEAQAWSVPNLDIQTSDVRCSHASTVGPLDEELLFYLASKGIPRDEAERLLARAFFADMGARFAPERGPLGEAVERKWG